MLKRTFDFVMALAGLVLLSPVMLAIAVAIRMDSPGPVLFRQERVGRHGQPFRILKFRSMRWQPAGDASSPELTIAGDARVTRTGSWLRASKLDELPQLVNVLRGEMSLVGPRPEVPRYVAHYPPEVRERVLSVRPGITDEASILFRNEGEILSRSSDPEQAYLTEVLPRKLEIYDAYARRHGLLGDLRILGRTFLRVMGG